MRLACIADIHGNSIALEAVLDDIEAHGGYDQLLVLGDLVALGPNPAGTLNRLRTLPHAIFIKGNTDHYVTSSDQPPPSAETVKADPNLLELYAIIARQTGWTQGLITSVNGIDFLRDLPLEHRQTLPNGMRLLAVHASPGQIDGAGFHPRLSQEEMRSQLIGCEADIVCVGHVHIPMDFELDGIRVINPGPISNPLPPDLRAGYVIIDVTETNLSISHHQVDYDLDTVIEAVEQSGFPNGAFLIDGFRGKHKIAWQPLTKE